MSDIHFNCDQYAIRHSRPHDGISNPNTVRVYNSAPRRVTLQIRYAKGFVTANLTIDQVNGLVDALVEASNETFPPLPDEQLLKIVKGV